MLGRIWPEMFALSEAEPIEVFAPPTKLRSLVVQVDVSSPIRLLVKRTIATLMRQIRPRLFVAYRPASLSANSATVLA